MTSVMSPFSETMRLMSSTTTSFPVASTIDAGRTGPGATGSGVGVAVGSGVGVGAGVGTGVAVG